METALSEEIDDIDIPTRDYELQSRENIMNNVTHLWRASNNKCVEIKENKSKNNKKEYIVLSTAFALRDKETSISLFNLKEKYKRKDLHSESISFLTFFSSESQSISEKTIPIALMRNLLIEKITSQEIEDLLVNGITKTHTSLDNDTFLIAEHWDINPPDDKDKKMHLLQNLLANCSQAYSNIFDNELYDQDLQKINPKRFLKGPEKPSKKI